MKIEITRSLWRWPYQWGAVTEDLYKRRYSSQYGDTKDYGWWQMSSSLSSWLRDRPPLWFNRPAVRFVFRSPSDRHFTMVADKGKLRFGSPPPVIWFARKSDILLMKLAHV